MANLSPPEFDLFCEEMLLILDGELRTVAILRMQGYTTQEIATRLDCSSRTVQRKLEDIAALWKKIAPDD
jgi:DNA-directed RNA polymerase specialized sigma24 family protein